jgi:hypothetical protein
MHVAGLVTKQPTEDPSRPKWMESFWGYSSGYVIEQRVEDATVKSLKWKRQCGWQAYQFEISSSQDLSNSSLHRQHGIPIDEENNSLR